MNSQEELTERLIKAFSVNSLKDVYGLTEYKGRQNELIKHVVGTNKDNIIKDVFFENFSLLKQHVFVYNGKGVFSNDWMDNNPSLYSIKEISKSEKIYNLLYVTTFSFFNKTKGIPQDIELFNPVQVIQKGTRLIVHINILERDLKSIVNDTITTAYRDLNEAKILENIFSYLPSTIQIYPCDINKGIKKLWDDDEIDALKVKYMNAKSVTSESMHEQMLVKAEYPDKYIEMTKAPLSSITFKVLKTKTLVNFFVTDPSKGTFNFVLFPPNRLGINELVDLVLKYN